MSTLVESKDKSIIVDQNVEVARRLVEEFFYQANSTAADETLEENIVATTGLSPTGPIHGREAYKQAFLEFAQAFSFKSFTIDEIFGVEDRVIVRLSAVVTHAQDYFGVAATQREIVLKEIHLMRLQDGKIVENIVSATNLEFEMLMAPVLAPLILDEPV